MKSVNADFVIQKVVDTPAVFQWTRDQMQRMRGLGSEWFRASVHPTIPRLTLIEGWKTRPVGNETQPDDIPWNIPEGWTDPNELTFSNVPSSAPSSTG